MQRNVYRLYIKTPITFAIEPAATGFPLPAEDKILSKKKRRSSALHHLPTTPKEPAKTGEVLKTENNRQSLASFYQNEFDWECIYTPGTLLDVHHTKRKSNRTRANGIAALTNFAKPVVTRIYDIALGGISLLYAEEMDVTEGTQKMDILIFDILTNFEYLINQVTGRVKSKKLVTDPKSKAPTWRYSIEFVGLDSVKQNRLKMLYTLVPPVIGQGSYESYLTPVNS